MAFIIKKKYPNGTERTFTVLSARMDEMEDSATIMTQENSAMVISKNDWPDAWEEFEKTSMHTTEKATAASRKPARLLEIAALKAQGT